MDADDDNTAVAQVSPPTYNAMQLQQTAISSANNNSATMTTIAATAAVVVDDTDAADTARAAQVSPPPPPPAHSVAQAVNPSVNDARREAYLEAQERRRRLQNQN